MLSGSLSMSTRRGLLVVLVAALLCGASGLQAVRAQDDPLKFTTDAAIVIWQVKPEAAADFEGAWTAIKTKLAASDKPEWKELGDGLKMFKVTAAGMPAGSPVVFVFQLNPPSKALSYDPSKILYAPGGLWTDRAESDALFKKIADALVAQGGLAPWPLAKIGS
jgi:hypothetical protein